MAVAAPFQEDLLDLEATFLSGRTLLTLFTNLMENNLLFYSLAQCDMCVENLRGKEITFTVSVDVNEKIIASL